MKKKSLLAIALFACSLFCGSAWFSFISQSDPGIDETTVYSALFAPKELGRVDYTIVIFDTTQRGFGDVETSDDEFRKVIDHVCQDIPEVEQETLDDFYYENQEEYSLKERFTLSSPNPFRLVRFNTVFVNGEELSKTFYYADSNQDPWGQFSEKYSGAREIYFLSRVGFNHARNQALVYVASECGGLCGGGNYVLLEKRFGFWLIQKRCMSWIR
jgi:hypothetical protein